MNIELETPLNATERYLHGVCVRLDVLIDIMSSFMEAYASKNEMAVENKIVETKTSTKKVKKSKEVV